MVSPRKTDKKMSAVQLRELNEAELKKMLFQESEQLMLARFKHATAALENTAELKILRRQIARISTVLNEKKG